MRQARLTAAALSIVITGVGCSGSKSRNAPTAPGFTLSTTIRTSDVLTGSPVGGASVSGNGVVAGTTNSAGLISVTASDNSTLGIDVSSPGYLTRNTRIKVPGADAAVSLIASDPTLFNLTAFDEMFRIDPMVVDSFRDGPLQRWISAPPLMISINVLRFDSATNTYTALDETLTASEVESIKADLTFGLPQLTGGAFQNFESVGQIGYSAGADVKLATDGRITYARCTGLSSAGTGTWLFRDDNVVTGGMLCLNRDFELGHDSLLRGVRIHELGHALGAKHVKARPSIMNEVIGTNDLNDEDRAAAKVAFARAPGNRSPDRDPSTFSTNGLRVRTATIDACRVRR